MSHAQLRSVLSNVRLVDILIPGFVSFDSTPPEFSMLLTDIFCQLDSGLLKLTAIGYTGRMTFRSAERVESSLDLRGERPCVVSMSSILLGHPANPSIHILHLWDAIETPNGTECGAARFDLGDGQRLFFDPTHHFGFRVGGEAQERLWAENSGSKEHTLLSLQLTEAI